VHPVGDLGPRINVGPRRNGDCHLQESLLLVVGPA